MKKSLLFFIILLCNFVDVKAQTNQLRILGGVISSNRWNANKDFYFSGGVRAVTFDKTEPVVTSSLALIGSGKLYKKTEWSVGFNFNTKGYKTVRERDDNTLSKYVYRTNYVGTLIGTRFFIFQKNKWNIKLETLFNMEKDVDDFLSLDLPKFSLWTMINIERRLNKNFLLAINPFFESSLVDYNPNRNYGMPLNYRPRGLGVQLGLNFSKID